MNPNETTPQNPADAAPEGSSWGRVPDGTGDFVVNRPTPGAANVGR